MTLAPNKTYLGLDYGQKRIGVAIGNNQSRLPRPLTTVTNDENMLQSLLALIREHQVAELVVGLPRGLKGLETPQTSSIREFISKIAKGVDIPIHSMDEDLTSVKAKEELDTRKVSYNKESVDALAATYILEDFFKSLELS